MLSAQQRYLLVRLLAPVQKVMAWCVPFGVVDNLHWYCEAKFTLVPNRSVCDISVLLQSVSGHADTKRHHKAVIWAVCMRKAVLSRLFQLTLIQGYPAMLLCLAEISSMRLQMEFLHKWLEN